MSHADLLLLPRIGVGFVLAYIFGFERELRGSAAGDRTFALVGASAAAITAVAFRTSPQAIAGVVTGLGFIGGGVIYRGGGGLIRGITTAATIFASAAIGIVVGSGHILLGTLTAGGLLLTLELQHIPFLRWFDAGNYKDRFQLDRDARAPLASTTSPHGEAPGEAFDDKAEHGPQGSSGSGYSGLERP